LKPENTSKGFAFLHFAPAQYKLGHAYEFAESPFPFDPLLSVQYYSLASQQGEVEADMALSKWFLCGSGAEIGVGQPRSLDSAIHCHSLASQQGNTDAIERLKVLNGPKGGVRGLSRGEGQ